MHLIVLHQQHRKVGTTMPVINGMYEETEAQRATVTPKVALLASGRESPNCGTFRTSRSPACWKEVLWDDLAILVLQENKAESIQLVSSRSPGGMRMVK